MDPGARAALVVAILLSLGGLGVAEARLMRCREGDTRAVDAALRRIRSSVDPCGESPEVSALLDRLQRCDRAAYSVCVDATVARNTFDRPSGATAVGTITWNPQLRTELEPSCNGDTGRAVRRDPTASLLHEFVHAAHDCDGLNAGALELEAVRVENIYRRAVGLCQRTGYGERRLAAEVVRIGIGRSCERLPAIVPTVAGSDVNRSPELEDTIRAGDAGPVPAAPASLR